MFRGMIAYLLALVLTVTGFSFAQARGDNLMLGLGSDFAMEMVICSGVGMKTITIGADGEPVETEHVCPDGAQSVVAEFSAPEVIRPQVEITFRYTASYALTLVSLASRDAIARGPPALI